VVAEDDPDRREAAFSAWIAARCDLEQGDGTSRSPLDPVIPYKSTVQLECLPQPECEESMAALTSLDMSADQAQAVIEAAKAKALELGTNMDIAVVDAGANLKAFLRMDDAWIGSIDIAIKKARTARFFNMPTGEIGKLSQPGGALYNIEHSNGGLISFPGGVPITDSSGAVIGAVGVSGSKVEDDHAVAEAGAGAAG